MKIQNIAVVSISKGINRLPVVANDAQIAVFFRQLADKNILRLVRVLVFVHQKIAPARLVLFKNFFILNNTKQYLMERYGQDFSPDRAIHPTVKLFKKCCKATYNAFLSVAHRLSIELGHTKIQSMLELAFKKFAWEQKGWWEVTDIDENETHPMRLFRAIIRKYDSRLHQEWPEYESLVENEKNYCRKFFAYFQFNDEQLQALLDYKDSFAMREVIARLLYKPGYVLSGFGCAKLCKRGMVCMKR